MYQGRWDPGKEPGALISLGTNPVACKTTLHDCQKETQNWIPPKHRSWAPLGEAMGTCCSSERESFLAQHFSCLIPNGTSTSLAYYLSGKSQDPDISQFSNTKFQSTAILPYPQSSQVCLFLLRKFNNTQFTSTPSACPQLNVLLLQRLTIDIHLKRILPRKSDQNAVFSNLLIQIARRTSVTAHHFK